MNGVVHERSKIDYIARVWPATRPIDEAPRFPIAGGPLSWSRYVAKLLREWDERSRQRWHLQMLDDRLLQDIKLTRTDVEAEVHKWRWMK
jgi:uncharacterized protein YjiS (DUF1127 family)